MVEDNPFMSELERMYSFCCEYKNIFIYRTEIIQKMISKYLFMSGLNVTGFIKPEVYENDRYNEPKPIYNLFEIKKKFVNEETGIILSVDDSVYSQVINTLKLIGFDNIFLVGNWNKKAITKKMIPRTIDEFYLEVNLADHCNLNCQCCDHFSPIAKKIFLNYDQYEKDIGRLSKLTGGHIGLLKLQGGEPLLNDRLIDYIKVTRKYFPNSRICLFTDGMLLYKWGAEYDLWTHVKENEIEIRMTEYPININIEKIKNQARDCGIPIFVDPPPFAKGARLWIFSEIGNLKYKGIKTSVKHPFTRNRCNEKFRWISCYQFNESIVLRDGKIYTCPMIPYSHYFNEYFQENLEVKDDCYIDIYSVSSFDEIAEFCTHRTSFCDYCAVHKRHSISWKQSKHDISEWML